MAFRIQISPHETGFWHPIWQLFRTTHLNDRLITSVNAATLPILLFITFEWNWIINVSYPLHWLRCKFGRLWRSGHYQQFFTVTKNVLRQYWTETAYIACSSTDLRHNRPRQGYTVCLCPVLLNNLGIVIAVGWGVFQIMPSALLPRRSEHQLAPTSTTDWVNII